MPACLLWFCSVIIFGFPPDVAPETADVVLFLVWSHGGESVKTVVEGALISLPAIDWLGG